MESVLVKSIYSVDTISKGNSKAWVKLMEYMDGKDYDVEFDFKGIEVVQPWATIEFKKFMQNPHVHIKMWSNLDTVNSINLMCMLNNFKENRAVNEEIKVERVPTKEELKIAAQAADLQKYFEVVDGVPTLLIYKRFDQIGVPITVAYIEAALKKYAADNGVNQLKLVTRNITIQSSVIENITNLIEQLAEVGVELDIDSNDTEVMNKVNIYRNLSKKKVFSSDDKEKFIKSTLKPGRVGMLIKYRESKATDEFGRSGKGKPLSCRAAIYLGMRHNKDGEAELHFRTYNGNTFYTKEHWALEHDNGVLSSLETTHEVMTIPQFGMYNNFLGSKFHFIEPVQLNAADSMTMYGVSNEGKVTRTIMTIPERIKAVFDDFDVEYDKESLELCIEKTRECLNK